MTSEPVVGWLFIRSPMGGDTVVGGSDNKAWQGAWRQTTRLLGIAIDFLGLADVSDRLEYTFWRLIFISWSFTFATQS